MAQPQKDDSQYRDQPINKTETKQADEVSRAGKDKGDDIDPGTDFPEPIVKP